MSLDLVQLRWQSLRATEALQLVEAENLALKKELKELREAKAAKAGKSSILNNELRRQCLAMKHIAMRLQTDVVKVKMSCVQELATVSNQRDILNKAFKNILLILKVKDREVSELDAEKKELLIQLSQARKQGDDQNSALLKDMAKLKQKSLELQEKILEKDGLFNASKDEIAALKKRNIELSEEASSAADKVERYKNESAGLAAEMQSLRSECSQIVEDAFAQRQGLQDHYEKVVDELGLELQFFQQTCADQEQQIARLQQSLVGNKSHFAKYVEVKTENLALQSKLESLSTKSGGSVVGSSKRGALKASPRSAAAAAAAIAAAGNGLSARAGGFLARMNLPAQDTLFPTKPPCGPPVAATAAAALGAASGDALDIALGTNSHAGTALSRFSGSENAHSMPPSIPPSGGLPAYQRNQQRLSQSQAQRYGEGGVGIPAGNIGSASGSVDVAVDDSSVISSATASAAISSAAVQQLLVPRSPPASPLTGTLPLAGESAVLGHFGSHARYEGAPRVGGGHGPADGDGGSSRSMRLPLNLIREQDCGQGQGQPGQEQGQKRGLSGSSAGNGSPQTSSRRVSFAAQQHQRQEQQRQEQRQEQRQQGNGNVSTVGGSDSLSAVVQGSQGPAHDASMGAVRSSSSSGGGRGATSIDGAGSGRMVPGLETKSARSHITSSSSSSAVAKSKARASLLSHSTSASAAASGKQQKASFISLETDSSGALRIGATVQPVTLMSAMASAAAAAGVPPPRSTAASTATSSASATTAGGDGRVPRKSLRFGAMQSKQKPVQINLTQHIDISNSSSKGISVGNSAR